MGKNKSKRLSPCLVSHSRRRRIVVCLSTFCAECKISCMCLVRDNCILQSHAHAHIRSVCELRQSDSAAKLSKLFVYAELGVNVASKYLTKNYSCFSLPLPLSFSFFSSLIQSQNSYALALPIRTIIRPISTNRCTRRKWMRTRIYSTQCSQ